MIRKKLYKAKKTWLVAAIAASLLVAFSVGTGTHVARADTVADSTNVTRQVNSVVQSNVSNEGKQSQASENATSDVQKQGNTVNDPIAEQSLSTSSQAVTSELNQTKAIQPEAATNASGWQTNNGSRYYNNSDGQHVTGWQKIDNNWYYFGNSGAMTNGWQYVNGSWYYLNNSGVMQTGWQNVNNARYYLNGSGAMQTGWQYLGNSWYYLNGSGAMQTGWQYLNNRWYYLNKSGVMTTGWQRINNSWYYLNGSGAMQTGWQYINRNWYYLNGSGAMATGWQSINGSWYYMNGSGAMTTGWQKVSGVWYYLNGSGAMQTGWQRINGSWYYLNGSGAMQTGWQWINGAWYYLNGSGAMATGWQKIGGNWYYLNGSGAMQTGWRYLNGTWYYLSGSGVMATGWQYVNDKPYFFTDSGAWDKNADISQAENQASQEQSDAINEVSSAQDEVDDATDTLKQDKENAVEEAKSNVDEAKDNLQEAESMLHEAQNYYPVPVPIIKKTSATTGEIAFTPLWNDFDPHDQNTYAQFDKDGVLTGDSAKIAAIFTADIVNGMRSQIGTKPVRVSEESIQTTQNVGHDVTHDSSYKGGHDVPVLSKYGLGECLGWWGEEFGSPKTGKMTIAQLKEGCYDQVLGFLHEMGYGRLQDDTSFPIIKYDAAQDGYGHQHEMLGLDTWCSIDGSVRGGGIIGANFDNHDAPRFHYDIIPDWTPKPQHFLNLDNQFSSKIDLTPYQNAVAKAKNALQDAQEKLKKAPDMSSGQLAKDQQKLTEAQNKLKAANDKYDQASALLARLGNY